MTSPVIEDVYPLTAIQQGLLFEGMAHEGERYVQQICIRFPEVQDTDRLQAALTMLVDQEPILRTMFDWEGEEPIQIVIGNSKPTISHYTSASADIELPSLLNKEMNALAPPNVGPPIRFMIIHSPKMAPALLVTYHHVLMDGPGVDILLNKLSKIYQTGESQPTANATKKYVGWTMAHVGDSELRFWHNHLRALKKRDGQLAPYAISQSEDTYRARKHLTPALNRSLRAAARDLHATPAVLVQALWTLWAGAYFHKKALHYGLVQSTRVPGLVDDDSVGAFINTLPWLAPDTGITLEQMTKHIQEEMLGMDRAKHYSLSAINQQVSPYASRFDAILTIAHNTGQSTYSVLATRENTGYMLAVDVDISANATELICAVPADMSDFGVDADTVINSFYEAIALYLADPTKLVQLPQTYQAVDVHLRQSVRLTDKQRKVVIAALQTVLTQPVSDSDLDKTFIELGGDSVDALKVSTLLAREGMRFPVGDLLEADSVAQAASGQQIITVATPRGATGTVLSLGQRVGLAFWQAGAKRDYHEQTAFKLEGAVDAKHFKQAVVQLTKSLPSLRTVYQLKEDSLPVPLVRPTMPIDLQHEDHAQQAFSAWVQKTADKDLEQEFDIEQGPVLRIRTAQAGQKNWYLFMSFPSFVCDGWSFSLLLERLFVLYSNSIHKRVQAPEVQKLPFQPLAKEVAISTGAGNIARSVAAEDVHTVSFTVPAEQVAAHASYARTQKITPSAFYMAAYCQSIAADTEISVGVYDAARTFDDGLTAKAVSMYGVVIPCHVTPQQDIAAYAKQAQSELAKGKAKIANAQNLGALTEPAEYYFVYENYPKDAETKLREDAIPYFKEQDDWRRQMLPPGVTEGLVVEPGLHGEIRVLLLYRGGEQASRQAKSHIKSLQHILNTINKKD